MHYLVPGGIQVRYSGHRVFTGLSSVWPVWPGKDPPTRPSGAGPASSLLVPQARLDVRASLTSKCGGEVSESEIEFTSHIMACNPKGF